MLFNKIGLAGSKLDINPEITTSGFKVYDYSTKIVPNYTRSMMYLILVLISHLKF